MNAYFVRQFNGSFDVPRGWRVGGLLGLGKLLASTSLQWEIGHAIVVMCVLVSQLNRLF